MFDDVDGSFRPCPTPEAVLVDVDATTVLVDRATRAAHTLNDTAALLWRVFDCQGSLAEIAADVADVFGLEPDTALDDVVTLVRDLAAAGVLEGFDVVEAPVTGPPEDCVDDEPVGERDPFAAPPYIAVPPNN